MCAKAIRDGVIDGVIDHKNGWLQLKETINVYTTNDPQTAFHRRITFCLDVHNEAVKVRPRWLFYKLMLVSTDASCLFLIAGDAIPA